LSDLPGRQRFQTAYAGQAPWDIGRPQPAFVAAADQVSGSVLDCGCGSGENALFFAARGHKVTGIDFLDEPVARARRKAEQRNLAASFLVMDALALKQIPEVFDTVIDSGLFHVFSDADRARYVEGLASVLKPGGRLFLLCFSDAEPGTQGPRRVTQQELRAAFARGWAVESVVPSRYEVTPASRAQLGFSEGGPKAWFAVARRGV
jgi:SAM-dependent methyltransferase